MFTVTVVFIVCPVCCCRLLNQTGKKGADPQRGAGGRLRGYLSTGSHTLPSRMYEHRDLHTQHTPTKYWCFYRGCVKKKLQYILLCFYLLPVAEHYINTNTNLSIILTSCLYLSYVKILLL